MTLPPLKKALAWVILVALLLLVWPVTLGGGVCALIAWALMEVGIISKPPRL